MSRPTLYVIAPFRGATTFQIEVRNAFLRSAVLLGWIPIYAPYLLCNFLRDDVREDRAQGMAIGVDLLRTCDAAAWVGTQEEIAASEGSTKELELLATTLHHKHVFRHDALPDAEAWRRWNHADQANRMLAEAEKESGS